MEIRVGLYCVFIFCLLDIKADVLNDVTKNGGSVVRIKNGETGQHLYAGELDPVGKNLRQVFLSTGSQQKNRSTENTDLWQMIPLGNGTFRLRNVKYTGEYLSAETDKERNGLTRRQIFTRKGTEDEVNVWNGEADWIVDAMLPVEGISLSYSIKNRRYQEYAYAASNDSQRIFTNSDWKGGAFEIQYEWDTADLRSNTTEIMTIKSPAITTLSPDSERTEPKDVKPTAKSTPDSTTPRSDMQNTSPKAPDNVTIESTTSSQTKRTKMTQVTDKFTTESVRIQSHFGNTSAQVTTVPANLESIHPSLGKKVADESFTFQILSITFGLMLMVTLISSVYICRHYHLIKKSRNVRVGNEDVPLVGRSRFD